MVWLCLLYLLNFWITFFHVSSFTSAFFILLKSVEDFQQQSQKINSCTKVEIQQNYDTTCVFTAFEFILYTIQQHESCNFPQPSSSSPYGYLKTVNSHPIFTLAHKSFKGIICHHTWKTTLHKNLNVPFRLTDTSILHSCRCL